VKDVAAQTVMLMVSADGGRTFNAAQVGPQRFRWWVQQLMGKPTKKVIDLSMDPDFSMLCEWGVCLFSRKVISQTPETGQGQGYDDVN